MEVGAHWVRPMYQKSRSRCRGPRTRSAPAAMMLQGVLKIALKYNSKSKLPAIKEIQRVSRPGLRQYTGFDEMPRVLNGLGIAIISTSRGLMTDKEAKKEKIGGEVLCYVY